jgi:predicted RNase H-like HicB family nuclease
MMTTTACTYLPWDGITITVQKLDKKKNYEARITVREGFWAKPSPGKEAAFEAMMAARGHGKTREKALEALDNALWQVLKDHELAPITNASTTFSISLGATASTGNAVFRL